LKNPEVDRLVDELVRATGESKTEAVRRALAERVLRLGQRAGLVSRGTRILEFLQAEVWPLLPEGAGCADGPGPPLR
jgi:antitoxin VapB